MKQGREQNVAKAAELAKLASAVMATMSADKKNAALLKIAKALESNATNILAANEEDMALAASRVKNGELSESLFQRLKLDKNKLDGVISGIRQIAAMPEPIGTRTLSRELDEDLVLYRITSPIGVVGVIFEARPEAMPQILSLCLKTSNAVILKGGAEAENSNRALFKVMLEAAQEAGLPQAAFALIETRADVKELLGAEHFVDLIIPRGSNELVRYIQSNTRIPVLGHADGICHIYVDSDADLEVALRVIVDSKIQYPSACNAVETLLIHKDVAEKLLPALCQGLDVKGVELRLDQSCREIMQSSPELHEKTKLASEEDWNTEYCDLIVSIKKVDSMEEAIFHINRHGSGHTESMISNNKARFDNFFAKVNSAGVYLNASTRFADGFRYGFGAEVGISTAKIHPRGPVGIEGLVTYKYQIVGKGHIVADYSGPQAKKFKHKDV